MSVLFGKYSFDGNPNPQVINEMWELLRDWEPDNEGLWKKDGVILGNFLLFNTPESLNEKLPFEDQEFQSVINADCRLDNREELLKLLHANNHLLNDKLPDSQLILMAYNKWGIRCVDYLLGDFAFVIWDQKIKKLFCVRDHLGVKPFFYTKYQNTILFSSLLKGLSNLRQVSDEVNERYVINILCALLPSGWGTYFKEIQKLPPGHLLIVDDTGKIDLKKYWEPDNNYKVRFKNEEDYVEAFREKLNQAIEARMRTSFPVGCQMSGGLDSTGILALAQNISIEKEIPLYAYTHGLSEKAYNTVFPFKDDFDFAKEACEYLKISKHIKVTEGNHKYFEDIDLINRLSGGPVGCNMTMPSYQVGKVAQQDEVRSILSGYVGDEGVTSQCFDYMNYYYHENSFLELFNKFQKHPKGVLTWYIKTLVKDKLPFFVKHKYNKAQLFNKQKLINEGFLNKESFKNVHNLTDYIDFELGSSIVRPINWKKITSKYLSQRFETENDGSVVTKTENRYPLADLRLLSFYQGLPIQQKINNGVSRLVFRKAIAGYLPDTFVWQNEKSKTPAVPSQMAIKVKDTDKIFHFIEKLRENKNLEFIDFDKVHKAMKAVESFNKKEKVKKRRYSGIVNTTMQISRFIEKTK